MKRSPDPKVARLAHLDALRWDVDPHQLLADYLVEGQRGESMDEFAHRWLFAR